MDTHCPICKKQYGILDRQMQPQMCSTCHNEGRSLPVKEPLPNHDPRVVRLARMLCLLGCAMLLGYAVFITLSPIPKGALIIRDSDGNEKWLFTQELFSAKHNVFNWPHYIHSLEALSQTVSRQYDPDMLDGFIMDERKKRPALLLLVFVMSLAAVGCLYVEHKLHKKEKTIKT